MVVHVGTSGYNYPEWRGTFYPEKMKATDMFAHYAARFHAVEINYTFYRMPTPKMTAAWHDQAPDGFRYVLKAPRRITHEQRLKGTGDTLAYFCESARGLGPHLAPLLFQLPPNFRCNVPLLESFLASVPADMQPVFEFRHDSWHSDEVISTLTARRAALCIADFGDKTTPLHATARHGYFRLRDAGYTAADLDRWAGEIQDRAERWDDVFVFFKHEDEGKGPEFAARFVQALEARGVSAA